MITAEPAVLLIDGDINHALLAKRALESEGLSVIFAHSGQEALVLIALEKIASVVINDAFLPDMHVLDLIDEIAANCNHRIPIIMNVAFPSGGVESLN